MKPEERRNAAADHAGSPETAYPRDSNFYEWEDVSLCRRYKNE